MKKLFTPVALLHLLLCLSITTAFAQTGDRYMTERLTGYNVEELEQGNWTVYDTANYTYTGTRGNPTEAEETCDMTAHLRADNNNVLKNYDRVTNTFDNSNRVTSTVKEKWNGLAWLQDTKVLTTYTTTGLIETYTQQEWLNNMWQNKYVTTYTYDNNGNRTGYAAQEWVNNAWQNLYRYTYTFDAGNRQLSEQKDDWESNVWKPDYKTMIVYDGNGLMTEYIRQNNNGSGLENTDRYTYLYNANQKAYQTVIETWVLSSFWMNSYKSVYTYDIDGNETSYSRQEWNSNTNVWENLSKETYTNDANGNRTVTLAQDWTNNAWVNNYRLNVVFDAGNRRLSNTVEDWVNNAWENSNRTLYSYDNNGFKSYEEFNQWKNNAWEGFNKSVYTNTIYGNVLTQLFTFWENGAYVDKTRKKNYYESFDNGLAVTETAFTHSRMYPNPSGGVVNVEFFANDESDVTVKVYNVSGVLVSSRTQAGNHGDNRFAFNTQNMAKGYYTVQLKSASAESNLKLVVN